MRLRYGLSAALLAACFVPISAQGQVYTWTQEQMIKYTAQNRYDRFPDGRPKVPDELLAKVGALSTAQAGVARIGYQNQFVDSLLNLHPAKKLVGRAVTLQLAPLRSDVGDVIQADWRAKGNQRLLDHQTALDTLGPGDVIVIDAFGSMPVGGIIGDNLAYYIWKKTGTGFVIDGAIRDLEGISEWDMPGFFRGATPPAIHGTMVMGINIPVRIGATTVMPGDVVLGDREGVVFIPPHLVQGVVDAAAAPARKQ
jgi:regulator of RNase E activity RraA